jgi:transmembrane sensor
MFNDRFAQLMARRLSGEATEQEIQELQIFLKENAKAQYFFEVFSDYWTIEPRPAADEVQEEIHFQQIIAIAEKGGTEEKQAPVYEIEEEKPSRIFTLKRVLIAAAITGIIATSYFLLRQQHAPQAAGIPMHEVAAGTGTKSELRLPDGTRVWLNSESKLEYKANFNDSIREVTLEGEAYFDVVKDKSRPFIVHTSDIDIRVLGTAFNVKSYPKDPAIVATLIHGMIEVTNKKLPSSPKVILRPHEKLVFNKNLECPPAVNQPAKTPDAYKPFAITTLPKNIPDTAVVETSWMYNKLIFDGETLRENASKMERWYNVKIDFRNDKVGYIPIRYQLENETIEEALKALQYIEPFIFKRNGNEIEILKK